MKKNAMLKIAAILMVAVLLTTCAISSTFAKYVTEAGTGAQQARVAKWGVNVDVNAITNMTNGLFLSSYGDADTDGRVAATGVSVVAPGTSNVLNLDAAIDGTPEVSGEIIITATFTITRDQWKVMYGDPEASTFHCPVTFALNGGARKSFADSDAGKTITFTDTKPFNPGESLDAKMDFEVDWEWLFTRGEDQDEIDENNELDTLLGNKEVANLPEIEYEISIQIVQTGSAAELD